MIRIGLALLAGMALALLAVAASGEPGVLTAEWLGWPVFFIGTAVAALPGLLLLAWLTRRGAATRVAPRGGGPVLGED